MSGEFIDGGKIVNTHGVRGAVKIEPWTDTPEFLCSFSRLFIDGTEYEIINASPHKNHVLATLRGLDTVEAAHALRGKIVKFAREDAEMDDGEVFIVDLIGLDAIDDATGETIGTIREFLTLPSNGVYVIKGEREIMIPAVPQFVREINVEGGFVRFHMMEGL